MLTSVYENFLVPNFDGKKILTYHWVFFGYHNSIMILSFLTNVSSSLKCSNCFEKLYVPFERLNDQFIPIFSIILLFEQLYVVFIPFSLFGGRSIEGIFNKILLENKQIIKWDIIRELDMTVDSIAQLLRWRVIHCNVDELNKKIVWCNY